MRRGSSEKAIMPLSDFLKPEGVIATLKAHSKKQALQELAERAAAAAGLPERDIFETLLQRERLGSTGIGHGIAIPHGKLPKVERLFGLFARLERPIDFEALDGEPVDLLFLLIAPEAAGADHLKALARVARVLRDTNVTQKLRATQDPAALYAILTEAPTSHAA
jgi:PTS system nitrogen regulatory IIA component